MLRVFLYWIYKSSDRSVYHRFCSQQAAFNQEVYQLLHEEEIVLKKLTRANVYKQVDYLTFLVTFQQQLQWKQAELQLKMIILH
ncbi:hypothetical protein CS542_03385 [Pedobacter sp. IW39]|nr:hypothetical protein CS542_03385 [Pedobacter sp. IW39]